MSRRAREWTTMGRLMAGAAIGSIAAVAWVVEMVRRNAARDVAQAPLWPRPDGSEQSFGEVWDIPTRPERRAASIEPGVGG